MRFTVVGADKESGDDVDVTLDATNMSEAEELAVKRGILVSAIKPAAPVAMGSTHRPEPEVITLIDDPPAENGAQAAERKAGMITVSANSPSDTSHTGSGRIEEGQRAEVTMEYHILMNQALYLLETAVNKHMKDGWEPTGGLTVGMSNNALQYFQSMIRRKKPKAE